MKIICFYIIVLFSISTLVTSCKTLEQASLHGLTSGYYTLNTENKRPQDVYLDVTDEQIDIYEHVHRTINKQQLFNIPLNTTGNLPVKHLMFKKQSLDIDITSIILKYRPSVLGLPPQLNTDLNIGVYVGWRYDHFRVMSKTDPIGKRRLIIGNFGYDVGFFAGPGVTMINSFNTNSQRLDEYSGMIIQTGFAGFIESNVASFGLSIGYDHLLNSDRKFWIYRNKPWVGFIVGIALN